MNRSGFKSPGKPLARTPFTSKRKPMKAKSAKKVAYDASPEGRADKEHMGNLADQPCIICETHGEIQTSKTTIHHPTHDRVQTDSDDGHSKAKGQRRAAHSRGLPICDGHHQGRYDTSKVALHREPDKWKELYGNDFDYVEKARAAVIRRTGQSFHDEGGF